MCDALVWAFETVTGIRWPEVISAFAAVAMAIIASLALKSWRRQDKAKREAEFLDELIESVHTFIAEMPDPIRLFEMVKIGMESHAPTWEEGDVAIKGVIAYIQKYGKEESKRLSVALEAVQPSLIRLRSLAAKGQVFKFDDYISCQNSVAMLTSQFDRIGACVPILGSSSLNWEHPDVLKFLNAILEIDPKDIRQSLQENNIMVLKFVSDTYKRIYG